MDNTLELYLAAVERHLQPLPASDRADIVQEIKSEMLELQTQKGLSPQEITERLGDPKALARAYLGDVIAQSRPLSWKRMAAFAAFYGVAGVGGVILLPVAAFLGGLLVFIGGTLMFAAGGALLEMLSSGLGLAFARHVYVNLPIDVPAPLVLLCLFLAGLLLFVLGCGFLALIVLYIRAIGKGTQKLHQF